MPKIVNSRGYRGSTLNSRVANYYQDRFLGFGYLAVGYAPPTPDLDLENFLAFMKQLVGYETAGYWKCVIASQYNCPNLYMTDRFFARDDAAQVLADHVRISVDIMSPFK